MQGLGRAKYIGMIVKRTRIFVSKVENSHLWYIPRVISPIFLMFIRSATFFQLFLCLDFCHNHWVSHFLPRSQFMLSHIPFHFVSHIFPFL